MILSQRVLPFVPCPKCNQKTLTRKSYPDENAWGLKKRLITCLNCSTIFDKVK